MFFSFAINRKHCRFCNVLFHTRCVCVCVCVYVCVCVCVCACVRVIGDGSGQIHFKIKQMGRDGVELANIAPFVDKLFKKSSRF